MVKKRSLYIIIALVILIGCLFLTPIKMANAQENSVYIVNLNYDNENTQNYIYQIPRGEYRFDLSNSQFNSFSEIVNYKINNVTIDNNLFSYSLSSGGSFGVPKLKINIIDDIFFSSSVPLNNINLVVNFRYGSNTTSKTISIVPVIYDLEISNISENVTIFTNINTTLSCEISNNILPTTFQWYENSINSNVSGVAVPFGNGENLTLNFQNECIKYYYCEINNGFKTIKSNTICVNVLNQPVILVEDCEQSIVVNENDSVRLFLSNNYVNNENFSFQWYQILNNNSICLIDSVESYIDFSNLTSGDYYYFCKITDLNNSTNCCNSTIFNLKVNKIIDVDTSTDYIENENDGEIVEIRKGKGFDFDFKILMSIFIVISICYLITDRLIFKFKKGRR